MTGSRVSSGGCRCVSVNIVLKGEWEKLCVSCPGCS